MSAAARQRISLWITERADPQEIRQYLLDEGLHESELDAIYAEFGTSAHRLRQGHRAVQQNRRLGGVLVGVGTVLGLLSLFVQSISGGAVIMAVGLLGYGLLMMLTGDNNLASWIFKRQKFSKTSHAERDTQPNG